MKALQLYVTSWVGESVEAEHYYCKVHEHPVEALERGCLIDDYCVPLGDSFRYIPTEEQALALARKDNYRGGGAKIREDADEYMENGVTRFWTLHQLCEEVHKKYPDMKLYGFLSDHFSFCKKYREENDKPQDFVVLKY